MEQIKIPANEEKFIHAWERVIMEVENLIRKERGRFDQQAALQLLHSTDFRRDATKT